MTESENEKAVQKMFDAYNRHDIDAMMNDVDEDVTLISPDNVSSDKEGAHRSWTNFLVAFPDGRLQIERMVSQENMVWIEFTWSGTNKKDYRGIPATNKKVEVKGVEIFDFESGKIKLWKDYWNIYGFSSAQLEKFISE